MAVPFQLSASATANQGDSKSGGLADIYFGSSFAVGSGAKATSDQDRSAAPGVVNLVIYGVFGLVALALVARMFRR